MTQNPDPKPEPKGYHPQEGCWPTLLAIILVIVLLFCAACGNDDSDSGWYWFVQDKETGDVYTYRQDFAALLAVSFLFMARRQLTKRHLCAFIISVTVALPVHAQSESVHIPLFLKGWSSQPHTTEITGDLHGYTWIHHDGWTAPWCGGTHVLLVDYAGQIMDHQYVGCEQYHFPDLPMSGNPYTLFGLAVVPTEPEPMTFGRAVRNIKVQPDALTLRGLVMTSPATVLMLP